MEIRDDESLISYLRTTNRILQDEVPTIQVLSGGVSNRTFLLTRPTGEAWVLKQALAKLDVSVDWFSDPARIAQEALGIQWLARLAPPGTIPPLVFFDPTQHILAMQAVPKPHENWRTMLLAGQLHEEHIRQFAELLAMVHCGSFERRAELEEIFCDRSYFESLRLEAYYAYTAEHVRETTAFYDALIKDTRAQRLGLVHGDYSPKNILVQNEQLILLDHEVIHFGDPAFDVGFSMTHLLSKAHHVSHLRREFAKATKLYWRVYRQAPGYVPWNTEYESRVVRHTLGCMLARVDGRSPMDYWTETERTRQHRVAVRLMQSDIRTVNELVDAYLVELGE